MNSGETVTFGAEEIAVMTSYNEVSAVNDVVAVVAEKSGIGGTIR